MCEVTVSNFNDVLSELEEKLKAARFVSLDTEFSCLNASRKLQNSLFDSGSERYAKLRTTVEQMIPIQIGLTAFSFDADSNSYAADIYTFYVFPRPFLFIDTKFLCQASSFQFLSSHKFDFNKFVDAGVPYLNRDQENQLLKYIRSNDITIQDSSMPMDVENMLEEHSEVITKWICDAKYDDSFILEDTKRIKNNLDIKYFLHKTIRHKFKNVWTYEDCEGLKIKKITAQQYQELTRKCNLEECVISDLLGFTKVFRLLTRLQKPIVGHNLLLDLMVMIHNFENVLPRSYNAFKKCAHSLFPAVYDTKCLSFDITKLIPDSKRWQKNTLDNLYVYFKDEHGRHLTLNSPLIEPRNKGQQRFHYAGWDSFCTGYIFIRMAHVYAAQRCSVKGKQFMSSELLQAVSPFKNQVNIIRADVSHIQLDGEDPVSERPPWLIVEAVENRPVDINQVTSLLSAYGFVEVKPHSFKGHQAVVAVDNFGSARRILKQFKSHSSFKVQQYNVLKHSPMARAVFWGGVLVSTTILAWYGYSRIK